MSHNHHSSGKADAGKRPPTFNKVFRWKPGQTAGPPPASVEVVGSFNDWQRVPLKYDAASQAWQLTLHHLPGNRTHNYMLLVDGKPAPDKHADGLAVPHSAQEKQHQLQTPRGPRIFMLFSQTK